MTWDRRRLLLAGGTAAATAVVGRAEAGETRPSLELDARAIGAPSAPGLRLGYHEVAAPPVLRVPRGAIVSVALKNSLAEPTALSWQGLRGENAIDVVPGFTGVAPLRPGATASMEIMTRESGTSWFHPPFVPGWSDQTARGLGGVLIVEEPTPPAVDDDAVLFLSDRVPATGPALADRVSVNGRVWPETKTYRPGARVRLRLVNGSTREALTASFEGGRASVIAVDGQPSELFRPLNDTLPVAPGARFDVLLDLPGDPEQIFRLLLRGVSQRETPASAVLVARLTGAREAEYPAVAALEQNSALPSAIPLEKALRAELVVRKLVGRNSAGANYAINGADGVELPKVPLFTAKRNTAATISFINHTTELIGFRLHGQAMRLLHALDDGWEPYWRDTVLVPSAKTAHVALVAPYPGRWLIDSPFFDQATTGLRHWFEIR